MGMKILNNDALKLILLGGKGGVGKTTCASSIALYLSEHFKTLLFSTDPAHSLSESLGQKIGDEITEVKGVKNLYALEISAEKAFSIFKSEYGEDIRKILDTSTYLDQEDIDSFLALSIPGIDEVMGFKTIVNLVEEEKYEKYVVDTAPTGHALRLLSLPKILDEWIKVMAKMRWKYRYMVERFSGTYNPDEADKFILDMKKSVKNIEMLLKNKNRCEFIVVTIPECMVLSETQRLVNTLTTFGIGVRKLIVNNVLDWRDCEFCKKKRTEQEKYLKEINKKFSNLDTTITPLQPNEVRGLDALNTFKELLIQ
jgi:arsenite/tail-anchored protein-transporting ATPase